MARKGEELKQIKGVGPAMAKRLMQAGFDTIDKIAAADVEALMKVKGVRQQTADSILEQALGLSSDKDEREPAEEVSPKAGKNKKGKASKAAGTPKKTGKEKSADEADDGGDGKMKEKLVRNAVILKDQMLEFAAQIKGKFGDQLKGKTAKKIEKELLTVVGCLEEIATGAGGSIAKKTAKIVKKAKKRMIAFCDSDTKAIGKGLRKIRKTLEKVIEK